MTREKSRNILVGISYVVIITAVLVVFGWMFEIEFLIRVSPNFASMKFITALLFILCGLQLLSTVRIFIDKKDACYPYFIFFTAASICLILLCSAIILNPGLGTILDSLPHPKTYDIWTRLPYMPSLMSLVIFLVNASCRLSLVTHFRQTLTILPFVAGLNFLIGFLAFFGNIFDISVLSYVTKYSGGMSFITSILFILVGFYMWILAKQLRFLRA